MSLHNGNTQRYGGPATGRSRVGLPTVCRRFPGPTANVVRGFLSRIRKNSVDANTLKSCESSDEGLRTPYKNRSRRCPRPVPVARCVLAACLLLLSVKVVWSCALPQPDAQAAPDGWATIADSEIQPDLGRRLLSRALAGRLKEEDLLPAAMVAGGVDDRPCLAAYESRVDEVCRTLRARGRLAGGVPERARSILQLVHDEFLTGPYDTHATSLDATLVEGTFNCVSSAVLFTCLARRCGLQVSIEELPGHLYCRVHNGDRSFVVETTCASWSVGREPDLKVSARQPQGADTPRTVSLIRLLAIIYYNRGIALLAEGDYTAALAANRCAFRLDPRGPNVRENLLATLNNWALDRCRQGDYAGAVQLIERGLKLQPDHEELLQNDLYVHQRWVQVLWHEQHYRQATHVLDAAHRRRPDIRFFKLGRFEAERRATEAVRPSQPGAVSNQRSR